MADKIHLIEVGPGGQLPPVVLGQVASRAAQEALAAEVADLASRSGTSVTEDE